MTCQFQKLNVVVLDGISENDLLVRILIRRVLQNFGSTYCWRRILFRSLISFLLNWVLTFRHCTLMPRLYRVVRVGMDADSQKAIIDETYPSFFTYLNTIAFFSGTNMVSLFYQPSSRGHSG